MGKMGIFLIATKSFFLNLKMGKMGIFLIATKSFFLNLKMGKMGIFLIATKSFFLNLKIGKMGIFFIATKSFFLNVKMGKLWIVFYNNKIFLPESQKWIFLATTKNGSCWMWKWVFQEQQKNGFGWISKWVFSVLDNNNNKKKLGLESSFTLALLFWEPIDQSTWIDCNLAPNYLLLLLQLLFPMFPFDEERYGQLGYLK